MLDLRSCGKLGQCYPMGILPYQNERKIMNQISTEVKSHVILFFDSSKVFITEQQRNGLIDKMTDSGVKQVDIDGQLYNLANIAKVLSLDEFYKEYPAQRPEPQREDQYKKYEGLETRPIGKNGLASMIAGLEKAIREYQAEGVDPKKAIKERDRLLKKFEHQYGNA